MILVNILNKLMFTIQQSILNSQWYPYIQSEIYWLYLNFQIPYTVNEFTITIQRIWPEGTFFLSQVKKNTTLQGCWNAGKGDTGKKKPFQNKLLKRKLIWMTRLFYKETPVIQQRT